MKALTTEFKSHGFDYKQVKRDGDVAIFSKTKPNQSGESYEVVRVKKYPTYAIAGVEIPEHESLPGDESWGDDGFTFTDLEKAKEKFYKLFADAPTSGVVGVATGGSRGRKRSEFEIELPEGEFTVKQLAEKYPERSIPFIHLRLNELKEKGQVKVVRTEKKEKQRGKASNVYKVVDLDELPEELEKVQKIIGH